MKMRSDSVKKAIISIITAVMVIMVSACGSSSNGQKETILQLKKDGSLQASISESFEQSYYDKEELQQMILSEAADYNRNVGTTDISVEKVEAEGGRVKVLMTYREPAAYAEFNHSVLFWGSPSEAQLAGYDLNVVLSGIQNPQETVGETDILAMEGTKLLITDVTDRIELYEKAIYSSSNVEITEKGKRIKIIDGSTDLAYIVIKK